MLHSLRFLAVVLLLVSCSKHLTSIPMETFASDQTAVLAQVQVVDSAQQPIQCFLTVESLRTGESFRLNTAVGDETHMVHLPHGQWYKGRSIVCRDWNYLLQEDVFPSFFVAPYKVNYLGSVSFIVHGLNIYTEWRRTTPGLVDAVRSLDPSHQKRLALAFTGQPLTLKMLGGEKQKYFHMRFSGPQDLSVVLDGYKFSGDRCFQRHRVPFLIGELEWRAFYRNGKLHELKQLSRAHPLGEEIPHCLETALRMTDVPTHEDFQVRITL